MSSLPLPQTMALPNGILAKASCTHWTVCEKTLLHITLTRELNMADSERDRKVRPPPLSAASANRHRPSGTRDPSIVMSATTRSSRVGSSGASSFKSSAFSETVKLRVEEKNGSDCWACGSKPSHICHVFAQEDQQVDIKYID